MFIFVCACILYMMLVWYIIKPKDTVPNWHITSETQPPEGIWVIGNDSPPFLIAHAFSRIYRRVSDDDWRWQHNEGIKQKPPRYWTHMPVLRLK